MADPCVLVTGASGFLGAALVKRLVVQANWRVRAASRSGWASATAVQTVRSPDLGPNASWHDALEGVDVIIHTAAAAHSVGRFTGRRYDYRAVNALGTATLARQAADAGIKRFIYISSIGVLGGSNSHLNSQTPPAPEGAYSRSKWQGEQALWKIAEISGMQVVVIRPPLIYGPYAPGRFAALLRIIQCPIPLPLGAVSDNCLSLVALDNLTDLINVCLDHPEAANQTLLVSDGEDISTTDLIRRLASLMGRQSLLIPVPASWLRAAAVLVGRERLAQKLLDSSHIDMSYTCSILGWEPPIGLQEGLKRAVQPRVAED